MSPSGEHVRAAHSLLATAAATLPFALSLACPSATADEDVALHPAVRSALERVDALLATKQKELRIAGMSAGIVLDQRRVWARGYGFADVAARRPAGPQTVYGIASVTKLFTATMLMQLRDAGKVRLDDPVTRFLPAWRVRSPFPDSRPPTLRQLVSHTSGLQKEVPRDARGHEPTTTADLIAALPRAEHVLPAFAEFKYSNLGYAVLGVALARAVREPYREYVTQHILRPLGMAHTSFSRADALGAHGATPYSVAADGSFQPLAVSESSEALAPAGGLYSSVEDMCRFMAAQFREGAGAGGILGGTTLREMRAPLFVDPDWKRAIAVGWWLEPLGAETVAWHGGQGMGYNTAVVLVPELRLGVALFLNTLEDPFALARSALEILAPAVREAAGSGEVDPFDVPPAEFPNYVGRYVLQDVAEVIVWEEGGKLKSRPGKGPALPPMEFVRIGKDRFRIKGGPFSGEIMAFERGPTGKLVRIQWGPYTFVRAR